ncbi:gamma-glutamylcyclotransferase family protein [Meridianimarinicoccus sp. MJW13]|uniref:gamma-glutamylcyclotransferase family protein n=1 Tax=Meridianimarinicoccus sp. MJW13 TaxID=2720031 RepID=UPI001867F164|nr:gamma-glutamylcyclotransferase family protein [Fluviibacterium sp. MJW13]
MAILEGILASVTRTVATNVTQSALKRPWWRNAHVRTFQEPANGGYNEEFYDYFCESIANAKSEVYVTGDGFNFKSGTAGQKIVTRYHKAFRTALENGVQVYRLQSQSICDADWVRLVGSLVEGHKDSFHMHLLNDASPGQLVSTCVIDPKDARNCVVELMLSTRLLSENNPSGLAGTAIFLHRRPEVARHLADKILALCNASTATRKLNTANEAEVMMCGKVNYFSFGSNMDHDQIRRRIGDVELIGKGVLSGHDVVFNRQGTYANGAVASIAPTQGSFVHGVIWRLSQEQLRKMDEIEDPSAYKREAIEVEDAQGNRYVCGVHVAIPQSDPPPPDRAYLELILAAARAQGLPDDYIGRLSEHRQPPLETH